MTNPAQQKPLSSCGDIYSMKCALYHVSPTTKQDAINYLQWLTYSRNYEAQHQNRKTVLQMIDRKIKKLEKIC